MRVLYLGNNRIGWKALEWLRAQGAEVVGLVVHPPRRRAHGDELIAASGLDEERIFDASRLKEPEVLERIASLEPELGVSVYLGYILRPGLLGLLPEGCVNLHPALLPYNRGAHTNVWSIVDGTPAGASLHWIDAGVDTGDLIAQREVEVEPIDTGESLYRKLENAALALFQESWPALAAGEAPRHPQPSGAGTFHRRRDLAALDALDLDAPTTARRLIDLLRARTFPPHAGAWFEHEGRKVLVRIELSYADEDD